MAVDMMRIFMPQKETELKLEQRKAKRVLIQWSRTDTKKLSHKRRLAERKRQVQEKLNQRKRHDDEGKAVMLKSMCVCDAARHFKEVKVVRRMFSPAGCIDALKA